MAKNKSTVYLGYDDEEITGKYLHSLNSLVNKIGGTADWPNGDIQVKACPVCGLMRPLIVQLYAPLEHSQFHRTLYVFGCLNPACSQLSKTWLCIRTQHLDTFSQEHEDVLSSVVGEGAKKKKKKQLKQQQQQATKSQISSWCSGSDDWGWGDSMDTEEFEETETLAFRQQEEQQHSQAPDEVEENGNVVPPRVDNALSASKAVYRGSSFDDDYIVADLDDEEEDEESNSLENDLLVYSMTNLEMGQSLKQQQSPQDDPNANCAAAAGLSPKDEQRLFGGGIGAGKTTTSMACSAEIEASENDAVLVDTPIKPDRDLLSLLKQPQGGNATLSFLAQLQDLSLVPYFISVDLEIRRDKMQYDHYDESLSAEHIRELYQEYKQKGDMLDDSPLNEGGKGKGEGFTAEAYEKTLPPHGDLVFHNFISVIQQNPGQVLRYSRDAMPLLMMPLSEPVPKCPNCNGETICEVQILPTLIPKLRLQRGKPDQSAPIEFGQVLLFTCLKSCWDTPDRMRYERVVVQAEK